MLKSTIDDAKTQEKNGLVTVVGSKKFHFMSDTKWRTAPNQTFVPINGEEFFITQSLGFIWNGQLKMNRLPIAVRDRYWSGEGNMLVQALWSFPMVNETGKEINISSLLRYLMEAVWIPTALLGDNIQWIALDIGDCTNDEWLHRCCRPSFRGKEIQLKISYFFFIRVLTKIG